MTKPRFIVPIMIMLALSACGRQGPSATDTPAVTETQALIALVANTDTPLAIETSAASETVAPTEAIAVPTNPPGCTNSAAFVADITIPDNTDVASGTTFTKIWRINNNGTCVWGPGYRLTHYSEERMAAPETLPLAVTYPGENLDVSIELTAPSSAGKHQANFVIKNPAGLIMKIDKDSRLWVVINVTVTTTETPTLAAAVTAAPTTTNSPATSTSAAVISVATESGSDSTAPCLFFLDRARLTETINVLNEYRAQRGLPAYAVNPKLAQAAQTQANDMACSKHIAHSGSDGSTPQTRVAAAGYVASSVSENIYGSYPPFTGRDVVNWWITDTSDPRHKENLLSTSFTEIGVGYSFFDNYGYYVIVFAKP